MVDLFCGAGGASVGYYRAGFDVVGVDIKKQPRYPFTFIQADAMTFDLSGYDFVHASPPCQKFSRATRCRPGAADRHEDLVGPIRDRLRESGAKYVIENVPGAPMQNPVTLCGMQFGLELYRHRLFEFNWWRLVAPPACRHLRPANSVVSVAGKIRKGPGEVAMGIDWMSTRELIQAVPPAYTEFVGRQLLAAE